MKFRTGMILAIALLLAITVAATSGVAMNNQLLAEQESRLAAQDQAGERAALQIDGELTAITVALEGAAYDIASGAEPKHALDKLMAKAPLLRVTYDSTTRPPAAEPLTIGAEGYRQEGGHIWQTSIEGVTLVAEIRGQIIEQHVWSTDQCTIFGDGKHFPTRGPTVTCQLFDASANSVLVGGGMTAGIVFTVGLGIAIFASVRLTKPVNDVRLAVEEIRRGNFDARATPQGTGDLSALASDINSMAAQLAQDRQQLQEFNGNLQGMVTERTQELEFEKASQESFFYGISHDLKGPLRSMNGFSQLLERTIAKGDLEKASHLVGKVRASSESMNRLVLQLLEFATSETETPNRALTHVDNALRGVVTEIQSHAPADVDIAVSSTVGPARIDASFLDRIVRNLVNNSIQHRPSAGVHINVHATRKPGQIIIAIEDNGNGIPEDLRSKLFLPFVRGNRTGSGLGLSIVQRLAAAHGGKVTLDSQEGSGATFTVILQEAQ